ncbi:biopolymer transport protein ExbD [Ulvibacter sp. MAR_2010_11]|uniref:ExbD/TolR family protein n=1 Tax=Ulvibacter sp. MAR_2010_11 TaxID=1250229 RepID=UPI000C2BFC23|nr:biopolymer transporter ExbD [Ulvibacter sp. MAR_2010_11]PKA84142.1 biopolymer transport protein ExbD [Ulvibacter sp. MAR_2010_11]
MRHLMKSPEVNAGSMADIAFLLLIFFLVTTTIPNDKGIARSLPPPCSPGEVCEDTFNERNVFRITINPEGELLINNELTELTQLRMLVKDFVDNNGDASCTHCFGKQLAISSDNPRKAAISLTTHRDTPYTYFIQVQDELTAAYFELREVYAKKEFKKEMDLLSQQELEQARKAYPFHISEASIRY